MTMITKGNTKPDERCCLCGVKLLPKTSSFRHRGTDKIICVFCIVDITELIAKNTEKK